MASAAARRPARRTSIPRAAPRRVSGPLRPARVAAGAVRAPVRRTGTGVFERIRALPDHRLVDRLLRGQAWIWLIGVGLGGIVAMQVSLLKLNAGISRAVESSATLERQNAELESSVARLSSGERIRAAAARRGMVAPDAGKVRYVKARGSEYAALAAARMRSPSDAARKLLAGGGLPVATVLQAPVQTAPPTTSPTGATAPVQPTGTDPGTTAPQGTTTPGTTPTTAATTPPAATAPTGGAAGTAAPQATPLATPQAGAAQARTHTGGAAAGRG
jgi:hypothetical protein